MAILENYISNEYVRFLILFIGTFIFVTLSYYILKLSVKRIAGKKKSYGEYILKKLSKPVLLIVLFIGIYSSLKTLTYLDDYYELVDGMIFVIITLLIALLI